jgi:hypothetical protein
MIKIYVIINRYDTIYYITVYLLIYICNIEILVVINLKPSELIYMVV